MQSWTYVCLGGHVTLGLRSGEGDQHRTNGVSDTKSGFVAVYIPPSLRSPSAIFLSFPNLSRCQGSPNQMNHNIIDSPDCSVWNSSSPMRSASNPHTRTRRTLRVRVACLRCQRRKIRVFSNCSAVLCRSIYSLIPADALSSSAMESSHHVDLA